MSFAGRDILTTEDLSREDILEIMRVSARMETVATKERVSTLLPDKLVAVIFLEPSTRTCLSFETAVHRLGARCLTVADAVGIPVINGGDGAGQHPTQALLDLYTIQKEKGTLEGLTVSMVGDLKYGRTVHFLSYTLAPFEPSYIYCSPKELVMPDQVV